MATNLTRTLTANGSRRKGTLSLWYKKCEIETSRMVFTSFTSGGYNHNLLFNTDDTLRFTSQVNSSVKINLITNRKFRDPNGWYHIVVNFDTEQGTSSNRAKMYINGVQETSFGTEVYPSQNDDLEVNKSGEHIFFNKNGDGAGMEATCCYSHIHYIDGTAYGADTFGSVDATTGEWKINTSPTMTMGTNGFTILKDGITVTDQSSNSNDFSVEQGTLTKTEDNPSNVFATYVPAKVFHSGGHDTSNGNTVGTNSTNSWYWRPANLAATSGKFYAEAKVTADGGGTLVIGIADLDDCVGYAPVDTHFGKTPVSPNGRGYAWYSDDGKIYYNDTSTSAITSGEYGANDILMIAMDLDNGAWYIGKNGSWLNSGDPTSGSSKTGAVNTWTGGGTWTFADAHANSGEFSWNWGNGYFKTTAISSEGTNASGIGKFEYNVPANYTALSTKGLNE